MPSEVTRFREGNPGKPKGAVNKSTRIVKEHFANVFNNLQGDKKANLEVWAKENPTEFYKLASKLIPVQLTGDEENPIAVNVAEGLTFEQLYQLKYGTKPI